MALRDADEFLLVDAFSGPTVALPRLLATSAAGWAVVLRDDTVAFVDMIGPPAEHTIDVGLFQELCSVRVAADQQTVALAGRTASGHFAVLWVGHPTGARSVVATEFDEDVLEPVPLANSGWFLLVPSGRGARAGCGDVVTSGVGLGGPSNGTGDVWLPTVSGWLDAYAPGLLLDGWVVGDPPGPFLSDLGEVVLLEREDRGLCPLADGWAAVLDAHRAPRCRRPDASADRGAIAEEVESISGSSDPSGDATTEPRATGSQHLLPDACDVAEASVTVASSSPETGGAADGGSGAPAFPLCATTGGNWSRDGAWRARYEAVADAAPSAEDEFASCGPAFVVVLEKWRANESFTLPARCVALAPLTILNDGVVVLACPDADGADVGNWDFRAQSWVGRPTLLPCSTEDPALGAGLRDPDGRVRYDGIWERLVDRMERCPFTAAANGLMVKGSCRDCAVVGCAYDELAVTLRDGVTMRSERQAGSHDWMLGSGGDVWWMEGGTVVGTGADCQSLVRADRLPERMGAAGGPCHYWLVDAPVVSTSPP